MLKPVNAFSLLLSALVVVTTAAKHKLVVGTFSTEYLYTLEYDDGTKSLSKVAQSSVKAASSWLALNHDKTKLYGTDWNALEPTFVSYDVSDPEDIKVETTIVAGTGCSGSKSIFVVADQTAPYAVYGNYYYGDAKCSTVFSVDENGTLKEAMQEYIYQTGSAVHGTAISPNEKYLFSADTKGNMLWTHEIDRTTGQLSSIGWVEGPSENSGPRHIAIHQSGNYAYIVLEEASAVAQYSIGDDGTLLRVGNLYSLLPDGLDSADYWADEVSLSAENKYLWATNRARGDQKGYISAFELDSTGQISKQLYLQETSTSGGFANSASGSPFDESIAALTDNSTGFVEIWDVNNGVIAHLDIRDGQGCCANAVWLD